jgi:uncharacterized protein
LAAFGDLFFGRRGERTACTAAPIVMYYLSTSQTNGTGGHAPDLPDVLTLDLVRGADDPQPLLRMLLVHIGVHGVKLRAEVAAMARAQGAQAVVCGHSHVPFLGRDRGLTVFNPGSIGPRRFHLPIVFGTIDVTSAGLRLAHVDCETGAPWTPP